MYLVELSFDGDPDRLALRPAHREKLADLHARGIVPMAGPFPDESGAVLVFDVADEAELDTVMADDPYYRAKGVTITRKQPWKPLPL
ncbi:MAG: YciI family protein [Stackebrandtia sp.]